MRHWIAYPRVSILFCSGIASGFFVQHVPLSNENSGSLPDQDAGDDFRHRVLNLDARVHLNEEVFVGIAIEQEPRPVPALEYPIAAHRRTLADSQIPRRTSIGRSMLEAISTTFWCRRRSCTEQSRSHRWTRLPWVSPRICTSMCLARPM